MNVETLAAARQYADRKIRKYGEKKNTLLNFQTVPTTIYNATGALDNAIVFQGDASLKVTTGVGQTRQLIYNILSPVVDMQELQFEYYFYIPDADYPDWKNTSLNVRYDSTRYWSAPVERYVLPLGEGWHVAIIPQAGFTSVGSSPASDWEAVSRVDLSTEMLAEKSVWYGALRTIQRPDSGIVVFTFDDGNADVYTNARRILSKYGYRAVVFIITNEVGSVDKMTWEQLKMLERLGWDIGSHTVNHVNLVDATYETVESELKDSQAILKEKGHAKGARFFASPYGEYPGYSDPKYDLLRSVYLCNRGIAEQTYFPPVPYDRHRFPAYKLNSCNIRTTNTLSEAKEKVDKAKATRSLLVFNLHGVGATSDMTEADFEALIDYIHASGLPVKTLSDIYDAI